MKVIEASHYKKTTKKLHSNEKNFLEDALNAVKKDPSIGKVLKGRFSADRAYRLKEMPKFRLIYSYDEQSDTLTLLEFEKRKNVYKKLSRNPFS